MQIYFCRIKSCQQGWPGHAVLTSAYGVRVKLSFAERFSSSLASSPGCPAGTGAQGSATQQSGQEKDWISLPGQGLCRTTVKVKADSELSNLCSSSPALCVLRDFGSAT